MENNNFILLILIFILMFILLINIVINYAYNSGSCKIKKKYICDNNFCLYKELSIQIPQNIQKNIDVLLDNKEIQKRVEIKMYPEMIYDCALPNKSGTTISTNNIVKYYPELIDYYQNELCNLISNKINIKLYPTELDFPTSCVLLIYDKEGDWINWHYDYNYYDGRFFTVLIPITNTLTCTKFQFKDKNNKVIDMDLTNNGICFEGNYLYHRASKICNNQKRIMLSCQYVTDNSMSFINQMRIKLKDFAFIGKLY
jgi:hypothetical protein